MSEPDFNCYPSGELDFSKLDPGIRETVRWFISQGFDTLDSGDGEYKERFETCCDWMPEPNVVVAVNDPKALIGTCHLILEKIRLAGVAGDDLDAVHVQGCYNADDESAIVLVVGLHDAALQTAGAL